MIASKLTVVVLLIARAPNALILGARSRKRSKRHHFALVGNSENRFLQDFEAFWSKMHGIYLRRFLTTLFAVSFILPFPCPFLAECKKRFILQHFVIFCAYMQRQQQNTGLMSPLNINLSLFVCLLLFWSLLCFCFHVAAISRSDPKAYRKKPQDDGS